MDKKIIVSAAFCAIPAFSTVLRAQGIEAVTGVVDCGQVEYRVPVTAEFELKNSSSRGLTINKVETGCGCLAVEYPTKTIASKETFALKVTYDAMSMGHFEKYVDVYCDGSDEPTELWLKGMVVEEVVDYAGNYPFKIGLLAADRTEIEFDNVNSGDRPQQVIHIRNVGSDAAQPVVMHLPDYLEAEVSPSKIAPGRSAVVTITLDSKALEDMGLTQTKVYIGSKPGDKVSADKMVEVSAVLLPEFKDMTEKELAVAPKISFSEKEIKFGPANGKNKLRKTIVIRNEGKSELRISNLQMFTAGVNISLGKSALAPGQETKLKVAVDPKQLKTARSEPRILMITNDPQNPKVVMKISVDGLARTTEQ